MALFRRMANIFRLRSLNRQIDDELQSHIELRTEENMTAGMTAEEARRDALIRFGNPTTTREKVAAADATLRFESSLRNVRYALRQLRRSPGFAITAILAMALGIGPNVAIFSIIWATFLSPAPYPNANQLVVVWRHYKGERIPTNGEEYAEFAAQSKAFGSLSFQSWLPMHLTNADHTADQEAGLPTSPGLATRTVQQPLAMGRDFLPTEGTPGNDRVVILTDWLWRHRYYADPNILGKSILIEDQPYTVIGVMKSSPHEKGGGVEFAVPILMTPGVRQIGILIGRLKPGVTIAQAQAEMAVIDEHYGQQHYGIHGASPFQLTVEHFRNDWLDLKTQRSLWLLLDAVGLVLLIACANVANLLLARGASRTQELAVRSALGATRRHIFVQLLTESLTVSLLGAAIGVGLGWGLMKLAILYLPNLALESSDTVVQMNVPVLAFALVIAVLAGVLAGCAPGWRSARINQSDALKQGSRTTCGRGRTPLQSGLVVMEIALALTLLAGAGMALHSFWRLSHIDVGITTDRILTAELHPKRNGMPWEVANPAQNLARQNALLDRLRQAPGVVDAALSTGLPMSGANAFPFTVVGQPFDPAHRPVADLEAGTPSFFSTFGIRLVRGRFLNEQDTPQSQPVVIVNETFVRRYMPNDDPLNHRLSFPVPATNPDASRPASPTQFQIVGVFHDVLNNEHLTGEVQPQMYICQWVMGRPFQVAVRTVVKDASSVSSAVQLAVSAAEPGASIDHVRTITELMEQERSSYRAEMILFGAFAAVALLLAGVGIFGVMAFAVAQRTHEIGVRMALGAERRDVVRLMLRNGIRMALVGIGVGLAGALFLGRLMHSTLYGMSSVDRLSLTGVAVLLFGVALLACWVPARRSAKIDPMQALRND